MSGTVLTRYSYSSATLSAKSNSLSSQVDEGVSRFLEEATDPKTLISLSAASLAYRWGRMGVMATTWARQAAPLQRPLSLVIGLGSEVTAFEFSNRLLHTVRATGRSPVHSQSPVTSHLSPNLWSWSGPGGWAQGLTSSAITFGMLKGAGFLAREQNLVFQHVFQSTAMVAGHNTGAVLGITSKPEGSLPEQLLHAEAVNLQLAAGMGLVHALAPRLHAFERSLDLANRGPLFFANRWNPFQTSLAIQTAGGPSTIPELIRPDSKPHTAPLLMSSTGEGKGGRRVYDTIPPPPEDAEPWKHHTFKTLAIRLGLSLPEAEKEGPLSLETQKQFRARVMDLIATEEVALELSPEHLHDLQNFVIGGWGKDSKIFMPIYRLSKVAQEKGLVKILPEGSLPMRAVPQDPKFPATILRSDEYFLAATPHEPKRPRDVKAQFILPGLGEAAAFTIPAGKPGKNEDAFGMNGKGVFIVADGVSGSNKGDLASATAVEIVVKGLRSSTDSLGEALLKAHQRILEAAHEGETVASVVRVTSDGRVEAALVGDVEIWVLRYQIDGSYEVIPYATFEGDIPNASLGMNGPLQLIQKIPPPKRGEIIASPVFLPAIDGTLSDEPLRLHEGDGILLMSDGLAKYYQHFPEQLAEILRGKRSAADLSQAIQEDAAARQEAFDWRQTYKKERRSLSRQGFKIPEGYRMAGRYITYGGMVFDSPKQENWLALFGSMDNQTALVFLRNSGARIPPEPTPPREGDSSPSLETSAPEPVVKPQILPINDLQAQPPPMRPMVLTVKYPIETMGEMIEKYASYFSQESFFLKGKSTLPIDTVFRFHLQLKGGDSILMGIGQVLSVRNPEDSSAGDPPGMEIKILKLNPESEPVLQKILSEKK